MSRPLRIEFPGAIYHITSRGDRQEDIFVDDTDRERLLEIVGQAMERFDAQMLAYCLMDNHYHFVLHTRRANVSILMKHVNGVFTQAFNRRHRKSGHLFQGRFHAILVDRDAYLLEVCRYVDLNPVRARATSTLEKWKWSSYLAHAGKVASPSWLDSAGLHAYLLGRAASTASQHRRAALRYEAFVVEGINTSLWTEGLRQQIYLGDEHFVTRMQMQADETRMASGEVPKAQRQNKRSLANWMNECSTRSEAIWCAYKMSGTTMTCIADELGLSVSRISRLIAAEEERIGRAKGKT